MKRHRTIRNITIRRPDASREPRHRAWRIIAGDVLPARLIAGTRIIARTPRIDVAALHAVVMTGVPLSVAVDRLRATAPRGSFFSKRPGES